MDKANATGIAGVLVGAGVAVAALALPWEISLWLRHVLFWLGTLVSVGGILWLLHLHFLHQYRVVRYSTPAIILSGLTIVMAFVEWMPGAGGHPGVGVYSVIRLYDSPENRKRYVFQFITSNAASAEFFLSASGQFTFAVKDIYGESYPLEARVGKNGIPIDAFVVLLCEAGVDRTSTHPKIFVNKQLIAWRDIPIAINFGTRDWHAGSLGAPLTGKNQYGIFEIAEIAVSSTAFSDGEISKLVDNASKFYDLSLN